MNEDYKTWKLVNDGGTGAFSYSYDSSNDADDWCLLPNTQMEPGNYRISYSYRTQSYPESFRVLLGQGDDPAAYTQVLFDQENYQNRDYVTDSTDITIEEGGEYRIALYAYSLKDQFSFYIKNVTIEELSPNKPAAPQAEITSNGFEGVMSITLPSTTYEGEPLSGTVSATVSLNEEVIATVSGTPGEVVEQALSVEARGNYTYAVQASVEVDGRKYYSDTVKVDHLFTRIVPNPLPLGYVVTPDEDEFALCTVVDVNEDGKTWQFYNSLSQVDKQYPNAFRYNGGYSQDGDDWLILPVYEGVETGAASVNFLVSTEYARENLKVAIANTPDVEALAANIIWSGEDFTTQGKFEPVLASGPIASGEPIYVAFYCSSPASRGYVYLQGVSLTATSPLVPLSAQIGEADFDGGNGTIKVTLPTETITNSPIEGTVYAALTLDGEPFGEPLEGTPGQEFTLNFEDLEKGPHTLTATSYVLVEDDVRLDGVAVSLEFRVKRGSWEVYTPPCTILLDGDIADDLVIVNNNDDSSTWNYDPEANAYRYVYHSTNSGNDWLILPAIQVANVSAPYKVTVNSKIASGSWHEKMEVYMGQEQSVAGMEIQVMEPTELENVEWADTEAEVTLPEPGNYYIGIHCISDPDKYRLYVKSVSMESTDPGVGVSAAKALNGNVTGLKGAICLSGFDGQEVSLINLAGQALKSFKAEGMQVINVPAGIYLVKAGENTFKVVVK